MRAIVGCEESGVVRDALAARGWDAWSCDIVPARRNHRVKHIRADVLTVLDDGWDLLIAHPPCTYLCSMGNWWNHKRPERRVAQDLAAKFFMALVNAPIECIAVENPIGVMSTRYRKPDQVINPWQFGHEANKPTCLWLKNLPPLVPTAIVGKGEFYTKANGARMSKWSHKCSGTRPAQRARIAATTFQGIADAMSDQWTKAILEQAA